MERKIDETTIEHICNLAKLHLSGEEQQKVRQDMEEMLEFMEVIKSLNTEGTEPMTHVFGGNHALREDTAVNRDGSAAALQNALNHENGMFKVPKTVG